MEDASGNEIYNDFKDARGVSVRLRVKDSKLYTRDGNFSWVYRAKVSQLFDDSSEKETQIVALKRTIIPRAKDFREVHLLRYLAVRFPHPNIVRLLYSQRRKYKIDVLYTLAFEFVPSTLAKVKNEYFKEKNVLDMKLCMWQLFAGLDHLRKIHIIHRDIKPANLLVNPTTGRLRIADFGSAIFLAPYSDRYQGTYAVTRYYRPPELILGAGRYNCMADVWSAGCIFAEIFIGEALFQGKDAYNQLQLIYEKLGTPTASDLIEMHVTENNFICCTKSQAVDPLQELFSIFEKLEYSEENNPASIINKILVLNPKKRLNGRRLLYDPFFEELFEEEKKRKNGNFVTDAISLEQQIRVFGTEI